MRRNSFFNCTIEKSFWDDTIYALPFFRNTSNGVWPHALFHKISVPGVWVVLLGFFFHLEGKDVKTAKTRLRLFRWNRRSDSPSESSMCQTVFSFSITVERQNLCYKPIRSMEAGFDLWAMEAISNIYIFNIYNIIIYHYNSTKNDMDFATEL